MPHSTTLANLKKQGKTGTALTQANVQIVHFIVCLIPFLDSTYFSFRVPFITIALEIRIRQYLSTVAECTRRYLSKDPSMPDLTKTKRLDELKSRFTRFTVSKMMQEFGITRRTAEPGFAGLAGPGGGALVRRVAGRAQAVDCRRSVSANLGALLHSGCHVPFSQPPDVRLF